MLDGIQNAAALKEGRAAAVDHDLGNGVVLDERLQRPQAHHVIQNLIDDGLALGRRQIGRLLHVERRLHRRT